MYNYLKKAYRLNVSNLKNGDMKRIIRDIMKSDSFVIAEGDVSSILAGLHDFIKVEGLGKPTSYLLLGSSSILYRIRSLFHIIGNEEKFFDTESLLYAIEEQSIAVPPENEDSAKSLVSEILAELNLLTPTGYILEIRKQDNNLYKIGWYKQ